MVRKFSVAVIIPYYNGSKFVDRALQSVASQSMPADEVFVVDDGSTISEAAALSEILVAFPDVKLISKLNGGQGSARNQGVFSSTSEFICFLDQDDYFLPNHIKDLVSKIPADDPRFGFVYADLAIADEHGNFLFANAVFEKGEHPKRSVINMISSDLWVLPSASLISRQSFIEVGGFDEQFTGYEDDDLFIRIFRAGYSNYFLPKSVTVWCMNMSSTSYSIKMVRSRFRYFKKLMVSFPDEIWRHVYFFREAIMPRFQTIFVHECIVATSSNDPNCSEFREILKAYAQCVLSNSTVPKTVKRKIKLISFVLTKPPILVSRTLWNFSKIFSLPRFITKILT